MKVNCSFNFEAKKEQSLIWKMNAFLNLKIGEDYDIS